MANGDGTQAVDYDALAAKYGGKAASPPDYDALAAKYGGKEAAPAKMSPGSFQTKPGAPILHAPAINPNAPSPTRAPGPLTQEEADKFIPPSRFEKEGAQSFAAQHPVSTGVLRAITTLGGIIPESTHAADYSLIPGIKSIVTHPIESAKAIGEPMVEAQKERFEKAHQASEESGRLEKAGHPLSSINQALNAAAYRAEGLIPVIGPYVGGLADELEHGETTHNPEESVHALTSALGGGLLSRINTTPSKVGTIRGAVRELTTPKAAPGLSDIATGNLAETGARRGVEGVVRGASPPAGKFGFRESVATAAPDLAEIERANPLSKSKTKGGILKPDMRVRQTVTNIDNRLEKIWNEQRQPQITRNAEAHTMTKEQLTGGLSPEEVSAVEKKLDTKLPDNINLQEADNLLKKVNARLRKIEGTTPENAALAKELSPVLGQLDTMKGKLHDSIAKTLEDRGEQGIKEFNRRYGALSDVRNSLRYRMNPSEAVRLLDDVRATGGLKGGVGLLERLHLKPSPGRLIQGGLEELAKTSLKPKVLAPNPPRIAGLLPPATPELPPIQGRTGTIPPIPGENIPITHAGTNAVLQGRLLPERSSGPVPLPPSGTAELAHPELFPEKGTLAEPASNVQRNPKTGRMARVFEGTPKPKVVGMTAEGPIHEGIPPIEASRKAVGLAPERGAIKTIGAEKLRTGDTFIDEEGHPRRVVNVNEDKSVDTADGSPKTYKGEVPMKGELNEPKSKIAQGGKFHPEEEKLPRLAESKDHIDIVEGKTGKVLKTYKNTPQGKELAKQDLPRWEAMAREEAEAGPRGNL